MGRAAPYPCPGQAPDPGYRRLTERDAERRSRDEVLKDGTSFTLHEIQKLFEAREKEGLFFEVVVARGV